MTSIEEHILCGPFSYQRPQYGDVLLKALFFTSTSKVLNN